MRRLTAGTLGVVLLVAGMLCGEDAADDASRARLFYDDGFTMETEDGRFRLRLNGGIQLRYSYVAYDERVVGNEKDYSNLYMRRARLWFTGHAGDPRLTYLIHIQLEPSRSINAHDMWLEWRFSDLVRLGAGRNKIAYGLEFLNSGAGLGMVERSVFSGETDIDRGSASTDGPVYPGGGTERFALTWFAPTGFATGGLNLYRSQGIQLQGRRGGADTSTFEYQAGVWQGRSTTGLSNADNGHLVSARVGWHPFGFVDWRFQGDGDGVRSPKLGLLASVYHHNDTRSLGDYDEHGWDVAAMLRWRGFSADFEWATETYDLATTTESIERQGWRLHLGWYLVPRKIEVGARYAQIQRLVDPTWRTATDSGLGVVSIREGGVEVTALEKVISEISAGVTYHLFGWHRIKLQGDVSRLERSFVGDTNAEVTGASEPVVGAADQVDWRVRTMIQAIF